MGSAHQTYAELLADALLRQYDALHAHANATNDSSHATNQ